MEKPIKKKGILELSPIEIYMNLPKTNCGECDEDNCMAFAVKLVNRESLLELCKPLFRDQKFIESRRFLNELLSPIIKEISIGNGDNAVKIGGKFVYYRHEFTYHNLTPIAIDVNDEMPLESAESDEESLVERIQKIKDFSYNYIGRDLHLDMIAVRSTSNDPSKFKTTVEKIIETADLPLVLCSFYPEILEAGLVSAYESRPLIYAATKDNWKEMAELALMYKCPLAVYAPGDLNLLRSLSKTLFEYGVKELVLDPGTLPDEGLSETINNFTIVRRNAFRKTDELFGFPLIGIPMTVWLDKESDRTVLEWKEAYIASMLLSRYADLLIMHSLDGWSQLPVLVWRFNLYTDPRKPVSVDSGLKSFGKPDENSAVMLTTNYALTYFTVESDIEKSKINCYLIVIDTEGISVESSVAGRYLTAEVIAEAIRKYEVEKKVNHRYLIVPGLAARLSGEIEEAMGEEWRVLVGPKDSSGIPKYLEKNWPPKK